MSTVYLQISLDRTTGPFVDNATLGETIGETIDTSVSIDESEYEISDVQTFVPPSLPKQKELKAALAASGLDEKAVGHCTETVWKILKARGLVAK